MLSLKYHNNQYHCHSQAFWRTCYNPGTYILDTKQEHWTIQVHPSSRREQVLSDNCWRQCFYSDNRYSIMWTVKATENVKEVTCPWEKTNSFWVALRADRNVWRTHTVLPEVTPAFSKEVSAQCQELCTRRIQTKRGKKIVKRRKRGDAAFTLPEIIGAKG